MFINKLLSRLRQPRGLALAVLGFTVFALLLLAAQYSTLIKVGRVFEQNGIQSLIERAKGKIVPDNALVEWKIALPDSYGIKSSKLDALAERFSEQGAAAFLFVKNGHLIYEWYAEGKDAEKSYPAAALAKPVIGSMVVMAAMDSGTIRLTDPAWMYIPEWKDEPQKSKITIGDLGSHRSGLADVVFDKNIPPGWKQFYYDNPELRFSLAVSQVPLIYDPGTRTQYSGVAFYALANALAHSLEEAPVSDVRKFLDAQVMSPLQIPAGAWRISYGTSYKDKGLRLYAIGSGSAYTPRAVARIGLLMMGRGEWNGQQIIQSNTVDAILGYTDPREGTPAESFGIGWRTNTQKTSPSLPADAFWGSGAADQLVLVIPSLDMVMVRMGGPLPYDPNLEGVRQLAPSGTFSEEGLEKHLFEPLMQAIN